MYAHSLVSPCIQWHQDITIHGKWAFRSASTVLYNITVLGLCEIGSFLKRATPFIGTRQDSPRMLATPSHQCITDIYYAYQSDAARPASVGLSSQGLIIAASDLLDLWTEQKLSVGGWTPNPTGRNVSLSQWKQFQHSFTGDAERFQQKEFGLGWCTIWEKLSPRMPTW